MIKLRVLEILKEQNHTKYWLYTKMNLSYQNFNRLVNNETRSIRYENIEKLCRILTVLRISFSRSLQTSKHPEILVPAPAGPRRIAVWNIQPEDSAKVRQMSSHFWLLVRGNLYEKV